MKDAKQTFCYANLGLYPPVRYTSRLCVSICSSDCMLMYVTSHGNQSLKPTQASLVGRKTGRSRINFHAVRRATVSGKKGFRPRPSAQQAVRKSFRKGKRSFAVIDSGSTILKQHYLLSDLHFSHVMPYFSCMRGSSLSPDSKDFLRPGPEISTWRVGEHR